MSMVAHDLTCDVKDLELVMAEGPELDDQLDYLIDYAMLVLGHPVGPVFPKTTWHDILI